MLEAANINGQILILAERKFKSGQMWRIFHLARKIVFIVNTSAHYCTLSVSEKFLVLWALLMFVSSTFLLVEHLSLLNWCGGRRRGKNPSDSGGWCMEGLLRWVAAGNRWRVCNALRHRVHIPGHDVSFISECPSLPSSPHIITVSQLCACASKSNQEISVLKIFTGLCMCVLVWWVVGGVFMDYKQHAN